MTSITAIDVEIGARVGQEPGDNVRASNLDKLKRDENGENRLRMQTHSASHRINVCVEFCSRPCVRIRMAILVFIRIVCYRLPEP
jgi:hypothetical protein